MGMKRKRRTTLLELVQDLQRRTSSEADLVRRVRRLPNIPSTRRRPLGSDDSHVPLHLLDHRIQPAAEHLLGETESEPLDGVER